MTVSEIAMLRELLSAVERTERELTFQAERLDAKAAERGNSRLRELQVEYQQAAATVRKLRVHQERRLQLLMTGSSGR